MKATSIFGGVQVFIILISIIRSKIVAVFLGQAGMGIMGLLNGTTAIVTNLTGFGLGTSAVKDIVQADIAGDKEKLVTTVTVFKRLIWITGLFGAVLTLILSPWLSELTFGNRDYTITFIWLSSSILFTQLTSGQLVILQGMRRLRYLANANIVGNAIGLVISVPLYYYFGIDGIVFSIIGTSAASLLATWYYTNRLSISVTRITRSQLTREGKGMLAMGFMISLSGLLTVVASYVVRIAINRMGDIQEVGLYNAGFAIINTYVGMVFTAMATDYYPRLSSVANDVSASRQIINQQAEIALLILAPILTVFLVFINWLIVLLYSNEFVGVSDMVCWAALGIFFKAASWPIGFIFLAKSNGRLFFWSELAVNIYMLAFNVVGYYYWGLTGIGISFLLSYFILLLQVYFISKAKYGFSFDRNFIKLFFFQFALALGCFLVLRYLPNPYTYIAGSLFIAISAWYSIKELNKRIGLFMLIKRFRDKFRKQDDKS